MTGSRWKHLKRGSVYEVVGLARMQIGTGVDGDTAGTLERRSFVVYRSISDDTLWVRPESEFKDGRFVELPEGFYLTRFDRENMVYVYYKCGADRGWKRNRDEATLYSDSSFAVRDRESLFTREIRDTILIRNSRD